MVRRLARPLRDFIDTEAAGGIALLVATVVALAWANSPWTDAYVSFSEDVEHVVNEGLMAVFFLLVGLEIKREVVVGELTTTRRAALPVIAAVGGMIVPALIYVVFNAGGEGSSGWGIPMATDIAFAVGVLALLGDRVPSGLKVFMLTLAIADDIGAIVIIALFYARDIEPLWLIVAAGGLSVMWVIREMPRAFILMALVAVVIWVAMLRSGVHATLAGVALGLLAPVTRSDGSETTVERLERLLHPWSSFVIVPLFALANAGVVLSGDALGDALTSDVALGVGIGLVVGKLIGVGGAALLSVRLGWAEAPDGVRSMHLVGGAAVAGIGFTVSLFIATLAFEQDLLVDAAKIGVLVGSVVAGLIGTVILSRGSRSS